MPYASFNVDECYLCGKPNKKIVYKSKFLGLKREKWEFELICSDCQEALDKIKIRDRLKEQKNWRLAREKLIGRGFLFINKGELKTAIKKLEDDFESGLIDEKEYFEGLWNYGNQYLKVVKPDTASKN